jgi:conjugal transfer pilus assembly protein TraF
MGWGRTLFAMNSTSASQLLVILALTLCLAVPSAFAGDAPRYYDRGEDGWFWYETAPVVKEPPKPEPQQQKGPAVLSTSWLRANIDTYRDRAIDSPTPENIRLYAFLEKLTRDRSERFAEQFVIQQQLDPMLDETARRPTANYALNMAKRAASTAASDVIKKITDMAGLWFFFRSDCPYCHAMSPILQRVQSAYQLAVLPISMDGLPMLDGSYPEFVIDRGQGDQLNVRGTPAMYLVHAGTGEKLAISQGSLAEDELLERMVQAAYAAGWITKDEWASTRTYRPLDDMEISQDELLRAQNDPSTLLELLSRNHGINATPVPQNTGAQR